MSEQDALTQRIERLRAALGWYAPAEDWRPTGYRTWTEYGWEHDEEPPAIYADEGKVARAALLLDAVGLDDDVTDEQVAAFDVLVDAGIVTVLALSPAARERLAAQLRAAVAGRGEETAR